MSYENLTNYNKGEHEGFVLSLVCEKKVRINFFWPVYFDQCILKWTNTLSDFKRDFQTEQNLVHRITQTQKYAFFREIIYLFIYLYQSKFWSLPANFVTLMNLRKYLSRVRNRRAMSRLEPVGKLL